MVRYALIIGITNYSSPYLPTLTKAAKDGEAIAHLLERYGDFQQVVRVPSAWSKTQQRERVSTQQLLSGAELGRELQTFLLERATNQDALIYFSGHGLTVTDSLGQREGYLAASDCQIEGANGNVTAQQYGISLDSLNRLIQRSNLSSLFVLLDSCHSGHFIERSLTEQTLNAFSRKKDYYLMTASRDFEKAWEGENYSVFTEAVLEGLAQSNADLRGTITGDRLFDYVSHQLKGSGQEPIRLGLGRSIVLVSHPKVEAEQHEQTFNPDNPYKGLSAFEQGDRDYFYGRKKAVREVINRLGGETRFLAVIGPSGCGKSSLVKAGLLPELENDVLPGSSQWVVETFTPGEYPLMKLEEVLHRHQQSQSPLLMVIDQFEEIFTLCKENKHATDQTQTPQWQFFQQLAELANAQTRPLRIIVALRIDFLERFNPYPDAVGLINQTNPATYLVPPLEIDELEEAIEQPALKHGVTFESGLPSRIAADVLSQPGALPLLQYALVELWETCIRSSDASKRQGDRQINRQRYTEIGGVTGALNRRATSIYTNCPPDEQTIIHDLFMELVELGDDQQVTGRRASLQQLRQRFQPNAEAFEQVLRLLSGQEQRLIVVDEETIEVAHEALLNRWALLQTWIEHDREDIRLRRRLESAYQEWVEVFHESDDALLTGAQLAVFDDWIQHGQPHLRDKERELYQKSIKRRDRQQKQKVRLYQRIAAGACISLVAIAGLGLFAGTKWRHANEGKILALASSSNANFQLRRTSIVPLIESLEAGQELQQTRWLGIASNVQSKVMQTLTQSVFGVQEQNQLIGHRNYVIGVSVDPKGEWIATASSDRTAKLWTTSGEESKTLATPDHFLNSITFSPDGEMIGAVSLEGGIWLWDRAGQPLQQLDGHTDAIWSIRFSPEGEYFITGSDDGTAQIWTREGQPIRRIDHGARVRNASISSTQIIATAGVDGIVKLWNWDGTPVRSLNGHNGSVLGISFSPDGQTIATAGDDGIAILWDVTQGIRKLTLRGHKSPVRAVAFSPDGQAIATGGYDDTVKLWNLSGQLLTTFEGHTGRVTDVAFSADGTRLASASEDRTVRLWQPNPWRTALIGHRTQILGLDISADGQVIASADASGTIVLWDETGTMQGRWSVGDLPIYQISLSPEGQTLAAALDDGTIQIRQLDGQLESTLRGHQSPVLSVDYSLTRDQLVTASADGMIKLWDGAGQNLETWQTPDASIVYNVRFSPDGEAIATANDDGSVKLWNLDGTLQTSINAHGAPVYQVSFSPDSSRLATAGGDNTVKLWKLDGTLLKTLTDHQAGVWDVQFSPNGQWLATASDDELVKLWSADGTLITTLTGHTSAVNALQFSPDSTKLATASADESVLLWDVENLTLAELINRSCEWLRPYLNAHPNQSAPVCQMNP
ncbi:MAG TPA: caspase family protein [Elainellaceae cyanobacterium]